jgi:oligo-alginate lyase
VRDQRLPYPVVVDVYRLTSAAQHTYDYPLHFRGQLITTNVPYKPHTADQKALGSAFGYQHIWNEASGPAGDSAAKLTWLDGHRYYTAITTAGAGAEVIFGRTGAADSSFNLISEPMMIVRQRASDQTFASVIEPHGFFSEMEERSLNARGVIAGVRVLASTSDGSVVEVTGANGLRWVVMINNGPASATAHHSVSAGGQAYQWTGNYSVTGVNAKS